MKLFVRGLFAGTMLTAGLVLTGCGSPSLAGPSFLDNPHPPSAVMPSAGGPQNAAPAADVARFRVGDTVTVSFSEVPIPIPDHVESIKEDGTITLPFIGSVHCVGKTSGELQKEIHDAYVPKYYLRLTVIVKTGDRYYYVGGEVNKAGVFQYVSGTTVTKAIQAAGGLNEFANHKKVFLNHASNGQRIQVNYDQALQDPSKDPPVYPDDQINVKKRIF
jgi:protein involved in polysaccharide export with SLBB domain